MSKEEISHMQYMGNKFIVGDWRLCESFDSSHSWFNKVFRSTKIWKYHLYSAAWFIGFPIRCCFHSQHYVAQQHESTGQWKSWDLGTHKIMTTILSFSSGKADRISSPRKWKWFKCRGYTPIKRTPQRRPVLYLTGNCPSMLVTVAPSVIAPDKNLLHARMLTEKQEIGGVLMRIGTKPYMWFVWASLMT